MSLNKATLEQLVELSNLIYDENDTVEVFLVMNDYNEQTTRESLIEVINEGIQELNYDGDTNDYNAIYWFVKGVKRSDDREIGGAFGQGFKKWTLRPGFPTLKSHSHSPKIRTKVKNNPQK